MSRRKKSSFASRFVVSSSADYDAVFLSRLAECEVHYTAVLRNIEDDDFANKLLKRTNTERSEPLLKFIMDVDAGDRRGDHKKLNDGSPEVQPPSLQSNTSSRKGSIDRMSSSCDSQGVSLSPPTRFVTTEQLILQISPEKVAPERIQKEDERTSCTAAFASDEEDEDDNPTTFFVKPGDFENRSSSFSATDELFEFVQSTLRQTSTTEDVQDCFLCGVLQSSDFSTTSVMPSDDNEHFVHWVSQLNCFHGLTSRHVEKNSDIVIDSVATFLLDKVLSELILDQVIRMESIA